MAMLVKDAHAVAVAIGIPQKVTAHARLHAARRGCIVRKCMPQGVVVLCASACLPMPWTQPSYGL